MTGRFEGEVIEVGRRGDGPGKAYAIVRTPAHGPVFTNVRGRAIADLQPGSLVAIEPLRHKGRGNRVKIHTLSALPLDQQLAARAETELDRELARGIAGEAGRLPTTPAVKDALAQRIAWHEREKTGGRDLTGRFEFADNALKGLRDGELAHEAHAFANLSGKRVIAIDDGLERDWIVRAVKTLHRGRFAMLERSDGVALLQLTKNQNLAVGKSYSISINAGKIKTSPALGLER